MTIKYKIGIDEVGRGPVAGPVAVCAFFIEAKDEESLKNSFQEKAGVEMTDSKKLTEKRREKLFIEIQKLKKEEKIFAKVSFVQASVIDKIGIVPAIQKALDTSLKNLLKDRDFQEIFPQIEKEITEKNLKVFLDGGLKAPEKFLNQETIIRGDSKEFVISTASVTAKVVRDHHMQELAKKYPNYFLEKHKGYGTKAHMKAIEDFGLTKEHRKTFLKKFL